MCTAAFSPDGYSAGILKAERYQGTRAAGVLGAVLVHAAVLPMLIEDESVPAVQSPQAAPVMVDLISTAQPRADAPQAVQKPVEPVKPKTETPKPKAKPKAVRLPARRSPLLSTPSQAAVQQMTAEQTPSPPEASAETVPAPRAATPVASAPVSVTPPRFNAAYLRNPAPAYPVGSLRRKEQGKVVLRVLVNAGGGAEAVNVQTSSGHGRLDAAALETVKQWKFVPACQGDMPVS